MLVTCSAAQGELFVRPQLELFGLLKRDNT